ncbi:hypothetical protein RVR34_00095 [Microcystis aeruginosa FBCC-A68]
MLGVGCWGLGKWGRGDVGTWGSCLITLSPQNPITLSPPVSCLLTITAG